MLTIRSLVRRRGGALVLLAAVAATPLPFAFATDHQDSPSTVGSPETDITDTFAWLDGDRVVLALAVTPGATASSTFSSTAKYVLHTASGASATALTDTRDFVCTFDAQQKIRCWADAVNPVDYAEGDASASAGLQSVNGHFKVFAGLRDDPSFFNMAGFKRLVSTYLQLGPIQGDAAGCPPISSGQSAALLQMLKSDASGAAPGSDTFAGKNVLAIVLSVDKALVTGGGKYLAVWSSTHE